MGEPAMGVPVGYPPNASPYTSYSAQPPSYASLQQAQPAQSSAAEKAVAGTFNVLGKALDKATQKTSQMLSHASAAGWTNTLTTVSGKVDYVARMVGSGGTAGYWKKMFSPPASEKLVSTWATHLYAQNGGMVAGVLFVGSLSLAFASDSPQGNGQFLKLHVPYQNVQQYQPATYQGQASVGMFTLDGFQFWFTGFTDHAGVVQSLTAAAAAYSAS